MRDNSIEERSHFPERGQFIGWGQVRRRGIKASCGSEPTAPHESMLGNAHGLHR